MPSRSTTIRLWLMLMAVAFGVGAAPSPAQVDPSAYGGSDTVLAGVTFANFSASFPYQSGSRLSGIGAFADFYGTARLGVEGNLRFLRFGGYQDVTESSFLAGPIFRFRWTGRVHPFARTLFGAGHIHYPYHIGDATYFAIAPAAGINYSITQSLTARAAYEYQWWANSPGYSNQPDHPLHPNGVEIGIAYSLFR